uniref:phosphatidylinositol 3-kinase n=1 Tax=Scylla olivacea TaxID=85551 RepID=A0A0P4VWE6_SCYOL
MFSLLIVHSPQIQVTGIIPERATLFKSALEPCRLTFKAAMGGEYVAIFKHGDDLRQDQLIIQIITLMDRLLRRENLDLRLTPYKVLATSSKHGFVQFIESHAVADVCTISPFDVIYGKYCKYNWYAVCFSLYSLILLA